MYRGHSCGHTDSHTHTQSSTHIHTLVWSQAETDEPLLKEEPPVTFTGEECLGRYLDLHTHFSAFLNARFGKKQQQGQAAKEGEDAPKGLEYYEYVVGLGSHLADVPRAQKLTAGYR